MFPFPSFSPSVASTGPAAISYTGAADLGTGNGGVTSFSGSVPIGAALSTRLVVVAISWVSVISATLSSATIGGVSATLIRKSTWPVTGSNMNLAIISAVVPSGTTATVSVAFTENGYSVYADAFRLTGLLSTTPTFVVDKGENAYLRTVQVNTTADGVLLAAVSNYAFVSISWDGITGRYLHKYPGSNTTFYQGACDATPTTQTGKTISMPRSDGTGTTTGTVIAVAFR